MRKNGVSMKHYLSFLFFSFIVYGSSGQGVSADQSASNQEAGMTDLQLKPIRLPALQEVGGSPFFSNDYKLGSVQISNEKTVTNVPVKFNIFSNALMVQKDGEELKLESFELVSYDEPGNDGTIKHINFRQGYPEIDNHTGNTIYQALAFGPKIHLLKFLSQKVEDAPTLGDYSRREIVTSQQLYIYIPGGEIKKIKAGKQSVVDALPGMSAKIDEAIKAGNLNLKSESDIITLVNGLNQ
ncbi:MAG TPA: hypothetical protein VIV35_09955 [Chitinophagaceae bacterium]